MTDKISTRGFEIPEGKPETFDDESNSVRVVAVTENPVRIWDWQYQDFIDEILLIKGLMLPPSRKVPLLDSHNRSSVQSVLGSARRFVPNGDILECDVFFSGTSAGKNAAQNVKEGHLTDFSVGYLPIESKYLKEGEIDEIDGKILHGPLKITKKWMLKELSITPIGADQYATARSRDFALPDSLPPSGPDAQDLSETGNNVSPEDESKAREQALEDGQQTHSQRQMNPLVGFVVKSMGKSIVDKIFYAFLITMLLSFLKGLFS